MKLSGNTSVNDLLTTHPFLEDIVVSLHPRFEMLKNRMARATIGRMATLSSAAGIADMPLESLLASIADEIEKQTGSRPEVDIREGSEEMARKQRLQILKDIIGDLHDGGDMESAKSRFATAVSDVDASEIAAMEEELIQEGLPVSEVQRLCDVHVDAFRTALDDHAEVVTPPGHPVHTYMAANRVIAELANQLGNLCRSDNTLSVEEILQTGDSLIKRLSGVENHYQRKENQLFSVLERHAITGPSKVMWGVHDQVRADIRELRQVVASRDIAAVQKTIPSLARQLSEMIYKEEKILFPLCLETLTPDEWVEIRKGDDELGYVLAHPGDDWPGQIDESSVRRHFSDDLLSVTTGNLSLAQLNLIFSHLPVDLSFVDETDTVQFYSEGPHRIFPRSPAVIGRKVQNCHPSKSVHMVQDILDAFRDGRQHVAEFWIQMQKRFILIRYYAIHDETGAYRGCLEVSQDVTEIRALQGERRLLEWTDA